MQRAPDDRGRRLARRRSSGAGGGSGRDPRAAPPDGNGPDAVRDWFEFETIVDLPAPAPTFADAAEAAAADYRRAARAENTRRAYRAAVARFTGWCAAHRPDRACRRRPTPSPPFSPPRRAAGLAVNTLRLRHAAIRYLHLLAGYPPPTARGAGRDHLRRHPPRPPPAACARRPRWCSTDCAPHCTQFPVRLPGLRDRALLLVGFAAALRPSEFARLDIGALTRHEDGIELFLPWRKNDQDAHGTKLWLPVGQTDLCPVVALEAWLGAAEITEGPLFRRIWRLPPPRVRRGDRTESR